MMKKCSKLLALLLAVVLAASLFALPASAQSAAKPCGSTNYPVVLVHGLLGWGSYDELNNIVPYWGMSTGSITDYLKLYGYKSYAASVGPLSSAWDRACELYAQLTGTQVDYGILHAKRYGHDQYGVSYTQRNKLIPGYNVSATNKINLVGHSFGGATIRLFLDILADGRMEEYNAEKAAGETPSEFFKGGKANWVYSLTTLAAPSNGTTFIEANEDFTADAADLATAMAKALGITKYKGVYDFDLDQFGIYKNNNETILEALDRVLKSDFMKHNDNAFEDLTIDKALYLNSGIQMQKGVYYFSYYGCRTYVNPLSGCSLPNLRMWIPLKGFAAKMGCYTGKTAGYFLDGYGAFLRKVAVPATVCDKTWQPSDGMVNIVSGRWPYHFLGGKVVSDDHVSYSGTGTVKTGVWNVLPVQPLDHVSFAGSFFNEGILSTHMLYQGIMKNIVSCGG
jgi:triacylglycerol lipase